MSSEHLSIPSLGLGTYKNTDPKECAETIRKAVNIGYRHIDTAEAYGNEVAIGMGIGTSAVSREDLFIATKVLHPRFASGYSAEEIVSSFEDCLERLGVDRVDLLYGVHWPRGGEYDPERTFSACAEIVERGQAKYIGVCNMTPELIDEAREYSPVSIDVLQVEMHPLLPQLELREYCDSAGIRLVAYAPLGNGSVLDVKEIEAIGEKYDVTAAQVGLAWLRQKDAIPIPKATTVAHLRENWDALELNLDDEDVQSIDAIDRRHREYNPSYSPDW